jgi:hypothetical protein
MRKRVIGLLLALCYLSVSLLLSQPHSHTDGKATAHQCAACSWHFESISDVPINPLFVVATVFLLKAAAEAPLQKTERGLRILSDRGPPVLS